MQSQKQSLSIPISIVIAGALIGFAIYMSGRPVNTLQAPDQNAPVAGDVKIAPVSSSDRIVGNPNAKIIIVEYSDTPTGHGKLWQRWLSSMGL
jgi:protein-disulfide isomerase